MFYTVYKTTNLINGKFYIGKHQTTDVNDGYMGSGKLLLRAIKKYGEYNFHKEILHICKSEKHMNILEKILVVPDHEINYNLCPGGKGGWGYLNDSSEKHVERCKKGYKNADLSKYNENRNYSLQSSRMKQWHKEGRLKSPPSWSGKKHSDDSKKKIGEKNSKYQKGSGNSQFGTMWITNGVLNKKIKKEEFDFYFEQGYYKGRMVK